MTEGILLSSAHRETGQSRNSARRPEGGLYGPAGSQGKYWRDAEPLSVMRNPCRCEIWGLEVEIELQKLAKKLGQTLRDSCILGPLNC